MAINYDQIWEFTEPHVTGGDSTVRLTSRQAIDYIRKIYPDVKSTDYDALNAFIQIYWARRIPYEIN